VFEVVFVRAQDGDGFAVSLAAMGADRNSLAAGHVGAGQGFKGVGDLLWGAAGNQVAAVAACAGA